MPPEQSNAPGHLSNSLRLYSSPLSLLHIMCPVHCCTYCFPPVCWNALETIRRIKGHRRKFPRSIDIFPPTYNAYETSLTSRILCPFQYSCVPYKWQSYNMILLCHVSNPSATTFHHEKIEQTAPGCKLQLRDPRSPWSNIFLATKSRLSFAGMDDVFAFRCKFTYRGIKPTMYCLPTVLKWKYRPGS